MRPSEGGLERAGGPPPKPNLASIAASVTAPETVPARRALSGGFVSDKIEIRPWPDAVIDTLGHDPRAPYPETYWLPTLGPTALALLRLVAYRFDRWPEGFILDLPETSRCLGLGERDGPNSPIARSLGRLVQFDLATGEGDRVVAVRRHVAPINRRHIRRLPVSLQ